MLLVAVYALTLASADPLDLLAGAVLAAAALAAALAPAALRSSGAGRAARRP